MFSFLRDQNGGPNKDDGTINPKFINTDNPITRPVNSVFLPFDVKEKLMKYALANDLKMRLDWQLDQNQVGDVIEVESAILRDKNKQLHLQIYTVDGNILVSANDGKVQSDIENLIVANSVKFKK